MNTEVVEALRAALEAHPEQRAGQIIFNALGSDPFYYSHKSVAERLQRYAKRP